MNRLVALSHTIVEHLTGLDALIGRMFSAVPVEVRGLGSWPVRAFVTLE